jgi:phage tail-like protein
MTQNIFRIDLLSRLPEVYRADPNSDAERRNEALLKQFKNFLSVFETVFTDVENTLASLAAVYDPDLVRTDALSRLEALLGVAVPPRVGEEARRRLLHTEYRAEPGRGTLAWLRERVAIVLGVDAVRVECVVHPSALRVNFVIDAGVPVPAHLPLAVRQLLEADSPPYLACSYTFIPLTPSPPTDSLSG